METPTHRAIGVKIRDITGIGLIMTESGRKNVKSSNLGVNFGIDTPNSGKYDVSL